MTTKPIDGYTLIPPEPTAQLLPEATRLGPVHLDVTDGENQKRFWTRYMGLAVIEECDDVITLGVDQDPMVVLHPAAESPVARRHTGLYHVAIHVPSQKELARICARLYGLGWEHAPTDHTETMATYCSDPDGNGIEITFETPERGSLARKDNQFAAIMADGTIRSGTEALDVDQLLSALTEDDDVMAPMPSGTRIGHVHLHVNDMAAARDFYINIIGLGDLRTMERFGMSDFSLPTSYIPHALAVNTWNGSMAQPRPSRSAGLRSWSLIVPTVDDLNAIIVRLKNESFTMDDHGTLSVDDPAGNRLVIRVGTNS